MISDTSSYLRKTCRMCDKVSLTKAMALTPTPPGNHFLSQKELGLNETIYPLDLYFCTNCYHVQLGHVVNPKILYQKNYTYVSETSAFFVKHLENYAVDMVNLFQLQPGSLVIDIGSNDGTTLSFFKKAGMKVLGIDPANNIALKATQKGIQTVADFFSYSLAVKLKKKFGPCKFFTSHNACAHIDDLFDVVKGVEHWLDDDGVFVIEVGYFVDVYQNTWFDTIYHEHLDYHTVGPFEKLFARVGMEVIDVQRIEPQGGSIRVIAQKQCGNNKRQKSVNKLIALEHALGLNKIDALYNFFRKINVVKEQLQRLAHSIKKDGKVIAGFGAPTKATTLMAHFGLDEKVLDFIVDDNPLKQGLYTPITHIPILSPDTVYECKPDYVIILAWNFAKPIMKMHEMYAKEIGKFIVPMPTPKIIE
jgi:SAM-dependent methyltransferase